MNALSANSGFLRFPNLCLSAIKNNGIDVNFTHLSTAGGAFLEYIEGKNLPGIEVLK